MLLVELTYNLRLPVIAEESELLVEINLFHWLLR
jgi:hypothetical protein